jgi:hypothetical protein
VTAFFAGGWAKNREKEDATKDQRTITVFLEMLQMFPGNYPHREKRVAGKIIVNRRLTIRVHRVLYRKEMNETFHLEHFKKCRNDIPCTPALS